MANREAFAIGGLWESHGREDAYFESFTMLTINADTYPVMNQCLAWLRDGSAFVECGNQRPLLICNIWLCIQQELKLVHSIKDSMGVQLRRIFPINPVFLL
jgi:hypothetical protein